MQSSFATPSERGGSGAGSSSQSFSKDETAFSTPINRSGAQSSPLAVRAVHNQSQHQQLKSSNGLRPRKSTGPDIGTPIKVASSSPYRTPESTSKASIFLSRTPFGTPSTKSARPSVVGTSSNTSKLGQNTSPPKPVTGFWPQVWPLCKSLIDGNAYSTFALLPRPHLTYSAFLDIGLRANWMKLIAFTLPFYHAFFCLALFRLNDPLQIITIPLRPTVLFLSALSYIVLLVSVLLLPGQPFSIANRKWKVQSHAGVRNEQFLGFTLAAGSPASLIIRSLGQQALWRGMILHVIVSLAFAISNALALMHYIDGNVDAFGGTNKGNSWTPYQSVSVRLSQGYKTTAIRPNERFWLLLSGNVCLGAVYSIIRSLALSRPSTAGAGAPAPFSPPQFEAQAIFESALTRFTKRMRIMAKSAVLFGSIAPAIVLQSYLLIRRPLFRVVLSLIGHHSPLRPILIPSFKRSLLSMDLVIRMTLLGLATVLLLEVCNSAWEILATQPIGLTSGGFSKYSREPTRCLIKGMQSRRVPLAEESHLGASERIYFSHFAFAEMATVVATDVERRKAIFRDVGTSSGNVTTTLTPGDIKSPNVDNGAGRSAWAMIATECMTVLQEERKWMMNKGKEPVKPGVGNSTTHQASKSHLKPVNASHQVTLAPGNSGIKGSKASIWDRLLSSSTIQPQPNKTATSITNTAVSTQTDSEGLGALLHRLAPPPSKPQPATGGAVVSASTGTSTTATSSPSSKITLMDIFANIVTSIFQSIGTGFTFLPSDLQHFLRNFILVRKVEDLHQWLLSSSDSSLLTIGILPHDEALTTWSVQILGSLLSASIDQDEYGTVALANSSKLGIDDVLEECAELLKILQKFAFDITQQKTSQISLQIFENDIAPLILALRTTITLVLGAFEPSGYRLRASCRKAVDEALSVPSSQIK